MLKNIVILTGIIILFSCNKKEKTDPKFNLEYRFINNGDSKITIMNGFSSTVFPKENIQSVISTDMNNPNPFDTLTITPSIQGYPGVKMFIAIRIRKDWNNEGDKVRSWKLPERTVNGPEDRIFTFTYPDDTLTAEPVK